LPNGSSISAFESFGTRLVAFGGVKGHAAAWMTTSGTEWKRVDLPGSADGTTIHTVARSRGVVFAFGTQYPDPGVAVWKSRDGVRWSRVSSDAFADASFFDVATHGRNLVAVGSTGGVSDAASIAAWTSTDGANWTPSIIRSPEPEYLLSAVWLDWRYLATAMSASGSRSVWTSSDGASWARVSDAAPARIGPLYAAPRGRDAFAIQFEEFGTFGGHLMTTRDGSAWVDVASFASAFPTANPDHIVRTHGWWILSGNTGVPGDSAGPSGVRRSDIWMSRDLVRWSELAPRLRGRATSGGNSVVVGSSRSLVVAASVLDDRALWLWEPESG
jgi:hypothetical protein